MPVDFNTLTFAVEGYLDRLSYLPGETIAFHCSARCKRFSIEIARIGAKREVVWRNDDFPGSYFPTPEHAYAKGCDWPITFTFPIPADWRSGFYEVTFHSRETTGPAATSHAAFVLRAPVDQPHSAILLVLATNTYNAYNKWGGHCLYTGATHVSFQRPWERGFITRPDTRYDGRVASIVPEGDPEHKQLIRYLEAGRYPLWCASGGWHNWERRFVRWAESNDIELDYAINSDLHFHPEILNHYRLMVSMGHDEYWSGEMRDAVDHFVETGGNLAIFSGNTCFWQVRYEDEGKTMVCYKGQARDRDPVMGTEEQTRLTTFWSHPLLGRPENLTTGLSFTRGGYVRVGGGVPRSSGAYTIYRPGHWAFADTGLRYGDQLGLGTYIVGYETDGCALTMEQGLPIPTHEDNTPDDLVILATSPARLLSQTATYSEIPKPIWADPDGPGDLEGIATGLFGDASPEHVAKIAHGNAVMGIFTLGKGTVFNAGTTDWAYGLDRDRLVQQVTMNVLHHLSVRR